MAAISTPKISSAASRVVEDFPELNFTHGEDFHWSPSTRTIHHPDIINLADIYQLLHEVGHARLGHRDYSSDATLIDMERDAWAYAVEALAPRYGLTIAMDDDIIQDSLDTYRGWLHARSTCPHCEAIGVQQSSSAYHCLVCQQHWRVNEARTCRLMRYKK